MTPDLSLLSGFARGVLLSLHVRDTCLHSGSWLLSFFLQLVAPPPICAQKVKSMYWSKSLILRHVGVPSRENFNRE